MVSSSVERNLAACGRTQLRAHRCPRHGTAHKEYSLDSNQRTIRLSDPAHISKRLQDSAVAVPSFVGVSRPFGKRNLGRPKRLQWPNPSFVLTSESCPCPGNMVRKHGYPLHVLRCRLSKSLGCCGLVPVHAHGNDRMRDRVKNLHCIVRNTISVKRYKTLGNSNLPLWKPCPGTPPQNYLSVSDHPASPGVDSILIVR